MLIVRKNPLHLPAWILKLRKVIQIIMYLSVIPVSNGLLITSLLQAISILLLKLSPKPGTDTAKRVKPFIGIYYITANYNNIQNQIFDLELDGALDKRHRANIEHYNDTNKPLYSQGHPKSNFSQCIEEQFNIERCISNKKLDRSQDLVQLIGWDTDLLNMRHNYVTHENWLSRRIKTFISSTLLDISEDRSVPSKSIDSVEIIDFTTGELRRFRVTSPNSQGMFSFDMFTKQQWYKQQRYFLKMVTFQIPNQMYTTKLVSINPWDYTWTHGFDVTIDNEQPTTCLNKTPEEKAALQALFDEQSTDQIKYLISQNIYHSVVEKLFCYNKELQKFYNIDTTDDSTYITLTLPELFLKFKEALSNDITRWINQEKDFLRNELSKKQITQPEYKIKIKNKTHAGYIFDKFKSVAEETLPSMYIHLLRSITTYPEYTLDDSLNRHLKYNMSFKLTPRVVRHEDITRGVQNKGPLRDGIYILQLAVMKNDQERKNGDSAMVSYQPSSSSEIEYVTDGFTNHLYSCNLKQSGCLTIDDFIIPPTNVPVLVREGMVRTKLKLALRQEQILFSDSKNLLIFRLLPVDPTSICPNDTEACMKNYGHYNYLEDVWNPDTLSKIKPITDRDYSNLIIHTYKAPFIMKNWANWTITHELREAFDELSERYFLEKNKNRLSHLHQQINESILNLTASENNNRYENNEQLKESAQLAVKQLEENRKKVNTTKTKIDQRIDELHGKPKIKDYTDALKYVTSTEIIHDPEETATIKNAEEVINDTFDTLKTAYNLESKKTNCNPLLITKSPSEITYQDCRKEESKDQNFDLSDIHIYNFASENALCILNVDSDNSKPEIGMLSKQKTCGLFKTSEAQQNTSSQTNQESFLVNINQQIKNINSRIKGISYGAPIYSPFFQNRDSSDNSPEPLPTLTKIDLEKIIHSGITPYNFTDSKTNSFTKALCGFWFDQFYQDYITPTQLVDSFHSKAKQSLYYQLRNITDHLPPDSEMTEYSRRAVNKLINTFNKEKIQLDSEGLLENYYQWTYNINNSFAHRLNSDLLEVFSGIILQSPFKNFSQKSRSVLFKSKSIGAVNNAPKVHPLHKCLRNPSHFFGFENKIIVGQINKDSKKHIYKSGVPETFRITENFFMNTQRDQGANQGSETSIGTQLALPIGAILIALSAIVPGGVILSVVGAAIITSGLRLQGKVDYTYRSFEGSGARRLISFIVENGLSLKSEQAKINIGLQNYHSCLVIRPRFSAFERDTYTHIWKENSDPVVRSLYEKTGMLLCAKGKKEKTITEDYFYISPNYTEANGNTIDTSSFRNKPFAISLRGKNAYHKFKDSLSCYVTESTKHIPNNQNCRYTKRQFKYLLNRKIEFTDNLKKGFNHPKLFHTTGYIPGVYDYYDKNEWGEIEEDSGSAEKFLKGLSDFQPDLDLTNFLKKAYH